MIKVQVGQEPGGLYKLSVSGHARAHGAESLPCAVVSSLLASLGRWTLEQKGLQTEGAASRPGSFELRVRVAGTQTQTGFLGAWSLSLRVLRDLAGEYPDEVVVEEYGTEEQGHGT